MEAGAEVVGLFKAPNHHPLVVNVSVRWEYGRGNDQWAGGRTGETNASVVCVRRGKDEAGDE